MIEEFFRSSRVRKRLGNGILCSVVGDFVEYLKARGHATNTIHQYVQATEHLGRWLSMENKKLPEVRPPDLRVDGRVPERGA